MQACTKAIVVKLAPREYRNLVRLAALLNKSPSDVVREYLCLPPESEASTAHQPAERHLRRVNGAR